MHDVTILIALVVYTVGASVLLWRIQVWEEEDHGGWKASFAVLGICTALVWPVFVLFCLVDEAKRKRS